MDETGLGGPAQFFVRVMNVAGLVTETTPRTAVVPRRPAPGYVEESVSNIPVV